MGGTRVTVVLLYGVCMGRLCIHHQSCAPARSWPHSHGSIQQQDLHIVLDILRARNNAVNADTIRRISANAY